jgi:hypothetical protein
MEDLIMKKLIMFCMVLMLCLGIAGKAQGELVCVVMSPAGAGLGDEVTLTGYDEEGAVFDLSELEVFESNFHHETGGFYPTLWKDGDNSSDNIDIVDGSIVFTLTDEMLMSDVTMWDCFFIPGGDDAAFRFCNVDPEDETAIFETVAEVLENGGTCDLPPPNPIVIDPNVMLVYETGTTVGDFDVSMYNALPTGETTTVTVDPNANGDGPNDDITLIGGSLVDGSITLTFTDTTATDTNSLDLAIASCDDWNPATKTSCWNCPQKVVYKAIDDEIAEPPDLEETQEILVTSVYSDTLQDPNWAGEKIVTVNVYDNDQANILLTYSALFSSGNPTPVTPYTAGNSIRMVEQPVYSFGTGYVLKRNIGVKLQVAPTGGDVRIVVFNEGESGNQPKLDPPLTEADDPNALIFTAANWDESQNIQIWGNDDDVLQIEEAGVEGDQNYQAEIAFIVADGGGDERYQWVVEGDEGPETEGILRVVAIDIEDNECGAFGISYLDVSNPYYLMNEDDLETAIGYHQDPNDWPVDRPDCYVDIHDVIEFATKWLNCSDPQNLNCESYLE